VLTPIRDQPLRRAGEGGSGSILGL